MKTTYYAFILKLRESLLKSLKITLKKIVKSMIEEPENYSSTVEFFLKKTTTLQRMISARYSMWSLVRDFSDNDKIFRREKIMSNNERYRDLLISILSYDEVSAFLLWVKARNQSLLTGRLICLS